MAISGCMQCCKTCGYFCGILAGLNIWFWIGMTIFNAMGNPWINQEIFKLDFTSPDADRYTWCFLACIIVSASTYWFRIK